MTEIALTFWNVGLQLSTLVAADVRLPPSVIEAVLFGNAGRTGEPADVSLADVWVEGYAATSAGLSLALPIPCSRSRWGSWLRGSPSSIPRVTPSRWAAAPARCRRRRCGPTSTAS